MQAASRGGRAIGLLILALIGFSGLPAVAQTQTAGTADEWITRLAGLETAPDLDIAALRQQFDGVHANESLRVIQQVT